MYIYIYTRAEAPLKVAEKGGEGGEERRGGRGIGEGSAGGRGWQSWLAGWGWGWGWGLGLGARARRANAALICIVNIYILLELLGRRGPA